MSLASVRRYFTSTDSLLFAAAVAGIVLYLFALPSQHPDAAADYHLDPEEAIDASRTFLEQAGYRTGRLTPDATFRRTPDLLTSLQADLGRPQTIDAMRNGALDRLPAYHWRVQWSREEEEGEGEDDVFTVQLNTSGTAWGFEREGTETPTLDRRALADVLRPQAQGVEQAAALPEALTDSLLRASLSFSETDSTWGVAAPVQPAFDGDRVRTMLLERDEQVRVKMGLGPSYAVALARHYLQRTALVGYDVRVDSTWVVRHEGQPTTARVRFVANEPYLGQELRTDLEITPAGGLLAIDTHFNPEEESSSSEVSGGMVTITSDGEVSGEVVGGIIQFVTYALLIITFLVLFVRRLSARVVDASAALRDASLGGLLVMGMMAVTAASEIIESAPGIWAAIGILGISMLFGGLGGAGSVFIVSSVADSVAREAWPEKLETLTFVRRTAFRNIPVGLSLLRGVALAGVLLGLLVLALLVFPGIHFAFDNETVFMSDEVLSPVVLWFTSYGWGSLALLMMTLLGIGALLYRWKPQAGVVITGITTVLILVQVGPGDIAQIGYTYLVAGTIGLTLAVTFWRYNFLTCFVGLILLLVFWRGATGWLIPGSPEEFDLVIALVIVGSIVVLGLAGLVSDRTEAELPRYVPNYVEEISQQERMHRELEIAHQVQESFLPRQMPEVEGVDLAAMCLAANEVGGDYYDFVKLDDRRLAVVVGDVSGKGIQAAFYMTLAKGFLQSLCREESSPAEVLRRVNALFWENVPRGTFISMIYGVLNVQERTFTFARAGHNPVILRRSPTQEPEMIQPAGMALGLTTGPTFDDSIEETHLHIRVGDVLTFYTDGFSEAMNRKKDQYGDDRLAWKIGEVGQRSASGVLQAVTEDVHHFIEGAGRHDDMTMVVIKLTGQSSYRPAQAEQAATTQA